MNQRQALDQLYRYQFSTASIIDSRRHRRVRLHNARMPAKPSKPISTGLGLTLFLCILGLLCVNGWGCCSAPTGYCETHRCDFTPLALAPVAQHDDVTPTAIAMLRKGTGLDFVQDDYGIPVTFVAQFSDVSADGDCAITVNMFDQYGVWMSASIEIAYPVPAGCRPPWATLMHEAIHAFRPRTEHTATGLFALKSNEVNYVDPAARAILCDGSLGECQ
jgi:hypothetical protein